MLRLDVFFIKRCFLLLVGGALQESVGALLYQVATDMPSFYKEVSTSHLRNC